MHPVAQIPRNAMEVFKILPAGTLCEVISNHLLMAPIPSTKHQEVLGNIFFKLKELVDKHNSGKVYLAPTDVYLNDENAVQPDLLFIRKNNLEIIKEDGIYGAPDLIVEILSGNRKHDKEVKLFLYRNSGVKEYIIVDPAINEVLHYELVDGDYILQGIYKNGKFISHLLNTEFTF